jgi:hypothetical protein
MNAATEKPRAMPQAPAAPDSVSTGAAESRDAVERPALVWWVLVLGGLTILWFDGSNPAFYAWWATHVNPLPSQAVLFWVFVACIPVHAGEALYVCMAAPPAGLVQSRWAWTLQTFLLGYPSTRLFRKRAARLRALTP